MTRVTLHRIVAAVLPAILVAGAVGGAYADETGVVRLNGTRRRPHLRQRLTDGRPQPVPEDGDIQQTSCEACGSGVCDSDVIYDGGAYCGDCYGHRGSHSFLSENAFADWLHNQAAIHRARNLENSARLHWKFKDACYHNRAWARCKLGYFIPTGCCGKGCPPSDSTAPSTPSTRITLTDATGRSTPRRASVAPSRFRSRRTSAIPTTTAGAFRPAA